MKNTLTKIVVKILLICILTLGSIGNVYADDIHASAALLPLFTQINFNSYTPTPFGNQDVQTVMTIEDGGNTLHLKDNSWKKISLPYTITPNTVLEFDFKSSVQSEVHGIGFDNDETMSDGLHSQTLWDPSLGN
jgi:extracellular elastinolytic metalloproteinase